MKIWKIHLFYLIFLFLISFVSADLIIETFDTSNTPLVEIQIPETSINYSIVNTNSSDYWDNMDTINSTQMEDNNGVLSISISWLTGLLDTLYCRLAGCTMTGDLKLNDNVNISDTGNNVRTYFEGSTMFIEG
ncbi:MAG: hypothetical protein ACOC5T_02210 [Elusimicrobiota bacterium]